MNFKIKLLTVTLGIIFSAIKLYAQNAGVNFEKSLTWKQVIEKAENESKFILVDCYATWCGPCKMMDKDVYSDTALGKFINEGFISVKVQMDSTRNDSEAIRNWYVDAHKIAADYQVSEYPTYLFFSPDGKLVHKETGYQTPFRFLKSAVYAMNRSTQEYYLFEQFKQGKLPDWQIPSLISLIARSGEEKQATFVARGYINSYLFKLPDELLFKIDNILLIGQFIQSTTDSAFHFFYSNQTKIDSLIEKGYSSGVLAAVIAKEQIYPQLWADNHKTTPITNSPDWKAIYLKVLNKYNKELADRSLIAPQIDWFKQHQQWKQMIEVEERRIENTFFDEHRNLLPGTTTALNNINFEYVVKHGTDRTQIQKAISWQKIIVEKMPENVDVIDTYANLLYKDGEKKEAIMQEEKALALRQAWYNNLKKQIDAAPNENNEDKEKTLKDQFKFVDEIRVTLQQMRTNKLSWNDTLSY